MNDAIKTQLAAPIQKLRRKLERKPPRPAGRGKPAKPTGWSAAQYQIVREARRAFQSWNESPEGKAQLAVLRGQDLVGLKRELDALIAGPVFARTRELVAAQRRNAGAGDFSLIEAISLGLVGQIDIGVGLYGSIGYAANLGELIGTSSVYVYGAFSEGADLGLDGGGQLGLWRKPVADMQGYYTGAEVEIDDGVGGTIIGLEQDEKLEAVLVDIVGGVNDGVEALELYALCFPIGHGPVAQPTADHFLILTNLTCVQSASPSTAHDEVYLEFKPDTGNAVYRYPTWNYYAMSEKTDDPDHNWALGRSIWFNNSVSVKVLEESGGKLAEYSFSFLDFNNGPGQSITKNSEEGGLNKVEYNLTAQLVM